MIERCPLCPSPWRLKFVTPANGLQILECPGCGLWRLGQQPSPAGRHAFYHDRYFESWGASEALPEPVRRMKQQTFHRMLHLIARYRRPPGRLLDVGCAFGTALEVAQTLGWDAEGLELNPAAAAQARAVFGDRIVEGDFEAAALRPGTYDAILMSDFLEHLPDPVAALRKVHRLLVPQGLVAIATPCTDSLSAKLLRRRWPHLKSEHLTYFSIRSLVRLLDRAGFRVCAITPHRKALTLDYLDQIFRSYPVSGITPVIHAVAALVPRPLRQRSFVVPTGEMLVIAERPPS